MSLLNTDKEIQDMSIFKINVESSDLNSLPIQAALPAYEEQPRTKWIFENSVQNTVVVSRAFFTAEVNAAFAELEDGNENALKVCISGCSEVARAGAQAAAHCKISE